MKRCPSCQRTFTDVSLNFCLEDGTPLVNDTGLDPGATLRYTDSPETSPPVTEIYPSQPPPSTPRPPVRYEMPPARQPDQWSPLPPMPPKKSNAVWWILGGLVVAGVVVAGIAVMFLALASIGSNQPTPTPTPETRTPVLLIAIPMQAMPTVRM